MAAHYASVTRKVSVNKIPIGVNTGGMKTWRRLEYTDCGFMICSMKNQSAIMQKAPEKETEQCLDLGTGWTGNEAFKAAFWAGQALDTELNITVASQNATAYKEQVLSTKSDACMPALKKYAEQKRYANLKFIDIDVEEGLDAAGLAPLDFAANRYNYIIISLGDAEHNWLAASELITTDWCSTIRKAIGPVRSSCKFF